MTSSSGEPPDAPPRFDGSAGRAARGAPQSRQSAPAVNAAIGYVRVSREEQVREGVSLDAQRARVTAYAQAKDLELVAILADEGLSGKDLNRPGLEQLLEACRRGEVQHVIVWKLDRLTRRTRHLLALVDDLFLARGIELHSVSESLDTSTPHGRFVLTLFGGLAQMERELIAERTRGALAWKRDQGFPTSHAPLGFRSRGKREPMEPVPAELEAVRHVFALWHQWPNYHTVADALNARAVPTKRGGRWYPSTVRDIVRRRDQYAGILRAS